MISIKNKIYFAYLEHEFQHIVITYNHYHPRKAFHVQFHPYSPHWNRLLFQ